MLVPENALADAVIRKEKMHEPNATTVERPAGQLRLALLAESRVLSFPSENL
jgi:hypothetical protein